jgi:hypothetical protein
VELRPFATVAAPAPSTMDSSIVILATGAIASGIGHTWDCMVPVLIGFLYGRSPVENRAATAYLSCPILTRIDCPCRRPPTIPTALEIRPRGNGRSRP